MERVEGRGLRYTTVRLPPLYLWTVGLAGSLVVLPPADMTSSTSYSLGGVDRYVNIVSAEVEAVTSWWWSRSSWV
jgi:hypothetical protein